MKILFYSLFFYWIGAVSLSASYQISDRNQLGTEQAQLRFRTTDSIKSIQQKNKIDSLHNIVGGVPIVLGKDTLFYTYTNYKGLLPIQKAIQIQSTINKLGKNFSINPNKVYVISDDSITNIMYGDKLIMTLTDKDTFYTQMSRKDLAILDKAIIIKALKILQKKYELKHLIKNIALVLLIIAIQYVLFRITNWEYWNLRKKLRSIRKKQLKPIFIKNYEFFSVGRQIRIIYLLLKILRFTVIFVQLLISISAIFSIFPQTEDVTIQIFSFIWILIKKMSIDAINYIPRLFTIIIIWTIFHYTVKGIRAVAEEIEKERLKLPNFYPDWAKPTFSIIRFLLYAFMIALIYPYLPHSESEAFKGISVLVGLIFSIGSSSAISNLVAGIIITYMRPFKIGDMIKINNIMGNVIEKTPIVTRILTIKNEIVTFPNAKVMNEQTTNLSESAKINGLILHFDVTFGYDTPWRTIHKILLDGAEATTNVLKKPHPFVLETNFGDFYTTYQINAYIKDADKLVQIFSELRQNIQDKFNEAGLSMVAPHYYKNPNKKL